MQRNLINVRDTEIRDIWTNESLQPDYQIRGMTSGERRSIIERDRIQKLPVISKRQTGRNLINKSLACTPGLLVVYRIHNSYSVNHDNPIVMLLHASALPTIPCSSSRHYLVLDSDFSTRRELEISLNGNGEGVLLLGYENHDRKLCALLFRDAFLFRIINCHVDHVRYHQ